MHSYFTAERAWRNREVSPAEVYMSKCNWRGLWGPRKRGVSKENAFLKKGEVFASLGLVDRFELIIRILQELKIIHDGGYNDAPPLIHRDIKPENILISIDTTAPKGKKIESVKIVDFGSAVEVSPDTRMARVGQYAGTLLYLPPETFIKRNLTQEVDIFSLSSFFALILGAKEEKVYADRSAIDRVFDAQSVDIHKATWILSRGYDFSTVDLFQFIPRELVKPIEKEVRTKLNSMQTNIDCLRPTCDCLLEFFIKQRENVLKIENSLEVGEENRVQAKV